jgi:hypothetical protein
MGMENYNRVNWKSIKVILIACLMVILPILPSEGGVIDSNITTTQIEKISTFKVVQQSVTTDNCTAYFKGTAGVDNCRVGEVPMPAATWLFVLALAAFVGLSSKNKI